MHGKRTLGANKADDAGEKTGFEARQGNPPKREESRARPLGNHNSRRWEHGGKETRSIGGGSGGLEGRRKKKEGRGGRGNTDFSRRKESSHERNAARKERKRVYSGKTRQCRRLTFSFSQHGRTSRGEASGRRSLLGPITHQSHRLRVPAQKNGACLPIGPY